jgi:predicted house-cleaning noncanonical NTP pyrophosphatase (MazG superfamily)
MGIVTHGKLVRDKIPAIVESNGEVARYRKLFTHDFREALKAKLVEEAKEVEGAVDHVELVNELADVLEVFYALLKANGLKLAQVERTRRDRAYNRGAFRSQLLLLYTEPKPEPQLKPRSRKRAAT